MENIADETTNDKAKVVEEMKEKVRVVSLVDPAMTKSSMDNSNVSVWSLCDINNDDTHVDLRDITPSISPVFTEEQVLELTEQQMVDPMTHRLLDDSDNIFSVGDIGQSLGSGQQKSSPLHDFPSDLEMFNREMQTIEDLSGVNQGSTDLMLKQLELNSNGDKAGKKNVVNKAGVNDTGLQDKKEDALGDNNYTVDKSTLQRPPQAGRRRSPRKQVGSPNVNSFTLPDSGMTLRRSKRQYHVMEQKDENLQKQKSEVVQPQESPAVSPAKEKNSGQNKAKKGPNRRSSRIAKHIGTGPEEIEDESNMKKVKTSSSSVDHGEARWDEVSKDQEQPAPGKNKTYSPVAQNIRDKQCENTSSETIQHESNILAQDDGVKSVGKVETENLTTTNAPVQEVTPDCLEKRVTRSTTGSLKPKQTFDVIQEKHEIEKARRAKKKVEETNKPEAPDPKTIKLNNLEKEIEGAHLKETNKDKKDDDKVKNALEKSDARTVDQKKNEAVSREPHKDKQTSNKKSIMKENNQNENEEPGKKAKKAKSTEPSDESDNSESESSEGEMDFHADDSDYSPEDDPDRLWCVCRKPHGNRFMICCDGCEEWFHGKCVGITMEQGRQMEKNGQEYVCTKCKEKRSKVSMEEEERPEPIETTTEPTFTREVYKHTRNSQKETTNPAPTAKPLHPIHLPADSSEVEEKKRKPKEPTGFKIPKKVRTTPTPASRSQPPQKCIVEGCPRSSFEGAVYCGRSCIEKHVSRALRILAGKEHVGKAHSPEGNRIAMIEKFSGRVIAGMAAPMMNQLAEWILKNPSFQVLVPGSSPTNHPSSFYNKPHTETKVKKEVDRKNEEETIRSNVRRTMKEILVARKRESSDIRISVEEIMKLVANIENDMHRAFKDTSHRYKAKYRTLMFNLKDPRNKVLYRRVLTGDIPPDKLIWMTSDELATKELAEWREQETKHMIDMIKKEEEDSNKTRLIKKTHKGEVDVDGDEDLSTLESSNTNEESDEDKKLKRDDKTEVLLVDTTDEHRAHLFDLNCKICTGKMAPPGEVVAKSPSSVSSSVPIQAAAESSVPSPPREVSFVGPPSPDSGEFATTSAVSKASSQVKEKAVWKGFVMMQSVAKFGTNAYLVSGSADDLIQVLPDTLHVHGRIAHEQVWDYVFQCKTSSSREMCLIRFAAATDEEKISYVSLYSYFHSRKRCGVIGNCYSGVKDMYLIPLASHQPVPPELMPFKGPGLQEPRPHMLLGLIIRSKVVKRQRPSADRVPSTSPCVPSTSPRVVGEPSSKRSNVNSADASKSTTPNSKSTTPTLPDSPVDEIEDIVFHFHNSQAKLYSEEAKPMPSSSQPIAPTINTLLKIREEEQKLRDLQEKSERLEKEIAPKNPALSTVFPLPSLSPSVSTAISRLSVSPGFGNNDNNQELVKSSTLGDPESLYDPETAYDEETPYDPEDLELCLEEEESTEKDNETTCEMVTKSVSNAASTVHAIASNSLAEMNADIVRALSGKPPGVPALFKALEERRRAVAIDFNVSSAAVDTEQNVPAPVLKKAVSHEYRKQDFDVSPTTPAGRWQGHFSEDPRQSRHRHVAVPDASQGGYYSERDYRGNRRENEDSRRDSEQSKFHSRSRPTERRRSDDRERSRYESHRQRGYYRRDRGYDRDRHSREKWRR